MQYRVLTLAINGVDSYIEVIDLAHLGELPVLLLCRDRDFAQAIGIAAFLQCGVVELTRHVQSKLKRSLLARRWIEPDFLDALHRRIAYQ